MYRTNITPTITVWQTILTQTQTLAARMPEETGINPDNLALLSFDDLVGTLTFLKRLKAKMEV